jgi:hypothetical protein
LTKIPANQVKEAAEHMIVALNIKAIPEFLSNLEFDYLEGLNILFN